MFHALDHNRHMRRAIEMGRRNPRAPFGAILVDAASGDLRAEGVNHTRDGPIWHGEMDAIQRCAATNPGIDWSRLALYTNAEPCPMCFGAILWANIGAVVFGTSIRTLQKLGWPQIDIHAEEMARRTPFCKCQLVGGILEAECDALFAAALKLPC